MAFKAALDIIIRMLVILVLTLTALTAYQGYLLVQDARTIVQHPERIADAFVKGQQDAAVSLAVRQIADAEVSAAFHDAASALLAGDTVTSRSHLVDLRVLMTERTWLAERTLVQEAIDAIDDGDTQHAQETMETLYQRLLEH